jgi:hypothetical protein
MPVISRLWPPAGSLCRAVFLEVSPILAATIVVVWLVLLDALSAPRFLGFVFLPLWLVATAVFVMSGLGWMYLGKMVVGGAIAATRGILLVMTLFLALFGQETMDVTLWFIGIDLAIPVASGLALVGAELFSRRAVVAPVAH